MSTLDRRSFLQLGGAAAFAAASPESLARLASVPAAHTSGTIKDVEHIVILMQENRAFDHYFGAMRGVRGFGDPRAVTLPNGRPVWFQPDGSREVAPFRPFDDMGRSFLPDPPHGWNDSHRAWNQGRYDHWVPSKGITAMTYHTRADLPYYYAVADAFTVCDAYFCSVMGPTDPNRYHLWTGWVGNDGLGGGPVITNAEAGYDWSTFPERLDRAGITWKVYQDIGQGLTADGVWGFTSDPYIGNFGDNALLYFHQYQNAADGTPLALGAKQGTDIKTSGTLFDQFRADVAGGTLPQVSYIAAPEAFSEHPNWAPDFGVWYASQFVDILAANPQVASKTVLFITYDEAGGFFDHLVPATPPSTPERGGSTVDIVNEIYPGDPGHPAGPYGLGTRVPMLVVSPWSKGGYVNSEVFDHTSLIKFIEARYADEAPEIVEPNITPWRRAVVGDLTSAFDFTDPDRKPVRLPSTAADAPPDTTTLYPDAALVAPADPAAPAQERGVRPARALPYALQAGASVDGSTVRLRFGNVGSAAAVLHVRSGKGEDPRDYTVGPGGSLTGEWPVTATGYDLSVHGPNGFFRRMTGSAPQVEVSAEYGEDGSTLVLTVSNLTRAALTVTVAEAYSGRRLTRSVAPGRPLRRELAVQGSGGWYEASVTVAGDAAFSRVLAGHLENGENSISDPAFGRSRSGA